MRAVLSLATALILVAGTRVSCAEPEWNLAAQTSLCALGNNQHFWEKTQFCGALRGDILFGRDRNASFALGPYATVGTAKFSDARYGGGLTLLIPTFDGDFPLMVSAGAASKDLTDFRVAEQLFFGLRSHNFHGSYAMASGIVLGGDESLSNGNAHTFYIGLQIDGLWLALPFILGYEWLKPSPDPGD